MAFFIEDDFLEASPPVELSVHSPLDGGSWTLCPYGSSNKWSLGSAYTLQCETDGSDGVLGHVTDSTTVGYYHSASPGSATDFDLYFDFLSYDDFSSSNGSFAFGVWRAPTTTQNGYAFGYTLGPTSGLYLRRYDGGTPTNLLSLGTRGANGVRTYHSFKVEVRGSQFTVFEWKDPGGGLQWVQIGQTTDSTYTSGEAIVYQAGVDTIQPAYIAFEYPDTPPAKPTITVDGQGPDYIDLSGSAFSAGTPAYAHYGSQWQVTLASDPTFASPVIDTYTINAETLTAFHAAGGLNLFLNTYICRVRYQDTALRWSDWSDASSVTSLETSGQYYTAFAERPLGVDIRTDIPADWSELDISDGASSWILAYRADATCQVTMNRVQLTGDQNSIDPITWEGFPSVATQIVFGRAVIDTITANLEPCTSGVADSTGIICREHYGLKYGPLYGPAGTGGVNPAGTTAPLAEAEYPAGTDDCLWVYDSGYDAAASDWVQLAWAAPGITQYWILCWPTMQVGGIFAAQRHLCGLYQTWGWATITNGLNDGLAQPLQEEYSHTKIGPNDTDNNGTGLAERHLAWRSHIGHPAEVRRSSLANTGGRVKVIEGCDCEFSPCGRVDPFYVDELIVCEANWVKFLDLPTGWKVRIGGTGPHVTTSTAFWPAAIIGDGSGEQYINFESFAFPADTMYVWFAGSDLLGPPDIEWSVPTGIWGGDIYRIKPTVEGAFGVGARLSGTYEGNDGQGYIAYLDAANGLVLAKWDYTTGLTTLGAVTFPIIPGTYYNIVLETTGSTIRAKAWAGGAGLQGDPENNDPGTWAISVTDTTYGTGQPGLVGLFDQPANFDAFAAGLGGDPYPTGRYPGACAWVSPSGDDIIDTSPVTLEWLPPTVIAGVLGGEITYELEYQVSGDSGWAPLASGLRTTTYAWSLDQLPAGYYCVRVRAYVGCEYGPWTPVCFQWLLGISRVPDGYFFGDWYTGEPDVGKWIRLFRASHTDDGQSVPGCLVTREILPAGVGGENLFQKLYVTVTTTTVGVLQVTPILDGEYIEEERRYINTHDIDPDNPVPNTGMRATRRHEIDLTRGWSDPEKWRYGMRGTYFQVEICATDYGGTGRIELDGVFLKYTKVRETHPWARPFYGELEVDVAYPVPSSFFFGTSTDDSDASIWKAEEGVSDFGEVLRAIIHTNKYAPFGEGNEGLFRTLYISITRSNISELNLVVTPTLDNAQLEQQTFSFAAVSQPVTEVIELPLSVPNIVGSTEVGRAGARGVWFAYIIATQGSRPEGEIVVNGAALDAIPLRETEPGAT